MKQDKDYWDRYETIDWFFLGISIPFFFIIFVIIFMNLILGTIACILFFIGVLYADWKWWLRKQKKLFCSKCGKRIPVDSAFCNKCGTSVESE